MKKKLKVVLFSKDKILSKRINKDLQVNFKFFSYSTIKELTSFVTKEYIDYLLVDFKSTGKDTSTIKLLTSLHKIPVILISNSVTEKVLNVSLDLEIKYFVQSKNIKTLAEIIISNSGSLKPNTGYAKPKFKKSEIGYSMNSDELLKIVSTNFPKSYVAIINKDYIVQYAGGEEFIKNKLNPDSYIGRTVQETLKAIDAKTLKIILSAYKRTFKGEEQNLELSLRNQIYHYKTVPLVDKIRNVYSILVVAENITQKKVLEKNLIDAEENYRTSLSRITDGFVALDKNWRFTYLNKRAIEIFNIDPTELIGKKVCAAFNEHEAKVFHDAYKKSMNTQKYVFVEEYYAPLNKWFENHIYPSPSGISIYFKDITEKKKSEEVVTELRKKSEAAIRIGNIGFWEWDVQQDQIYWSDRMYEIFDRPKGSMINYKMVLDCIHPEDKDYHDKVVKSQIKKLNKTTLEYRLITKDGRIKYLEVQSEVVRDKKGKAIKFQGTSIDNSERIFAEKALIKSEAKYRTFVEQASDAIFIVEANGKLSSFNSSTLKLSGYSKKELLEKTIYDFVYPQDIAEMPFKFDELFAGKTATAERRIKRKNNIPIYTEITAKVINDNKILVFAKDITERKKYQTELIKNKLRFQNLIENISGVYWVLDVDSRKILYVSPSYENIMGGKCVDLYNDFTSFFKTIHPDDLQFVQEQYAKTQLNLTLDFKYRLILPGGETRWIKVKANIIKDLEGRLIKYGYAEDITERKKSEIENLTLLSRNQQIINTMLDGFFLADKNGKFIEVNQSYCEMVGYTRDELLKMNENDLKVIKSIEGTHRKFEEAKKKKHIQFESQHIKKNGEIVDFNVSLSIMSVNDQLLMSAFLKDITEHNKAQQKILDYTEQLKMLTTHLQNVREDERSALSRELHDEIGQQLLAIKIDVARLSGYIVESQETVKLIAEIKNLIDDSISTVRRINSELRPSLLDDMGLFAALEYQVKEITKRTNIKFELNISMTEPVLDDKTSIGVFRIFQESLTNIVKHAEANIVTANLHNNSGKMELLIKDNGRGFDLSDGTLNKTFGLLGMKERASMIKGTLDIKSKPGDGTEVSLIVPIN